MRTKLIFKFEELIPADDMVFEMQIKPKVDKKTKIISIKKPSKTCKDASTRLF
jgi:hypothetical protein